MAKVRTLSRVFMKGHPKAGELTHFIEKAFNSIGYSNIKYLKEMNPNIDVAFLQTVCDLFDESITDKKGHTIRMGRHFKAKDELTLAGWSGRPYHTNQIKLWTGPIRAIDVDIRVGDPWDEDREPLEFWKNEESPIDFNTLAANDGLSPKDFNDWFIGTLPKVKERFGQFAWYEAQILIWNPEINY